MRIFHFKWESYKWEDVVSTSLSSQNHFLNNSDCYGLYYITGSHYIYGKDTLLYLGKAQDQRFGYRLNQHSDFDYTNIPQINELFVGKLSERDNATHENWGEVIAISERLFINALIPAMNSSGVKWVLDQKEYGDILILNWNNFGAILPEISGFRFSNKYWNNDLFPEILLSE